MKQQTALDWLIEQFPRIETIVAYNVLEQAKQMERVEHMKTWENKVISKIYNFEVYHKDLGIMNWKDAKKACEELEEGWRLPNKEELNLMYLDKEVIGGFANDYYWSSTEFDNDYAWLQGFSNGSQGSNSSKGGKCNVRAVRAIIKK